MTILVKDADMQIERLEIPPYPTNAYIVTCQKTRDSVLIDAPEEADKIIERLKGTNPKYILMTHSHRDHTGALAEVHSKLKVPLAVHASEATNLPSPPDKLLNDGDVITVGDLKLEVLHTPGHTPGSLCFKVGRSLISGDTIFPGGPGHTRSAADFRQIIKSITEKILVLPDDTPLYPGHGDFTIVKKAKEEYALFSSRSHSPSLYGDVLWLSS